MKKLITSLFLLHLLGFVIFTDSVFGQKIYTESFNYPLGQLPSDWVLQAEQTPPWSVSNSAIAGGEAPELFLGYSFAMGSSRLISKSINIEGYQQLCLKYKQYLINYEMDYGEIIGLDITFDGGESWQPLWESPLGLLNILQDEFTYYFSPPEGATELQFAFRYEGNSYAINAWAIDDISIEIVPDNDLLPTKILGTTTPNADEQTVFFVEVVNGGKLSQTNYTVKLMTGEGVELASVPGEQIGFAEKKYHLLWWTPTEENIGDNDIYVYVDFTQDEILTNNRKDQVISVQPKDTKNVQIGSGSWPLKHCVPYNFFTLYSLTQSLYYSQEINIENTPVQIGGIQYTYQFDENEQDVPIQIYLGETNENNLAEEWVDPSTLTLVFDGLIDFAKGYNTLYIPLDNAYEYKGGNLVIYSNKSYSKQAVWTPFISTLDTDLTRSRIAERDDAAFDPANPSVDGSYYSGYYPNITLFYSTGISSIGRNILDEGSVILYPNPVNDKLFVQADETVIEIRMANALGKTVYQKNIGSKQHEIDVAAFSPGVYLVQVFTSRGVVSKKILISK